MSQSGEQSKQITKNVEDRSLNVQSNEKPVVYSAGPITGLINNNKDAFFAMEKTLTKKGFIALNPAVLPDGLTQNKYMDIDLAMLRSADAICPLDGWQHSSGAVTEYHLAV